MTSSRIPSQSYPPLEDLRIDLCAVITQHKVGLSPLDGIDTDRAADTADPDIEDIREQFYARLEDLRFPKGGIPGILLQPPCRPSGLGTHDLEMAFPGSYEGQQLAAEWVAAGWWPRGQRT